MAGLERYRLSDEQSQKIFTQQILPAEFPSNATKASRPSGKPLAVMAVGQTGAGKTLLTPAILSALESTPVHLIADTYKTYHPDYAMLMETTPAQASPATGYDARKWLAMAAGEAVRRGVDVVLESACRHPDDFCELAEVFHEGGYRLEVVVMAVPEALSRLGIVVRFREGRTEGLRGLPVRLTPVKVHDDSYRGLEGAAGWLDSWGRADQVVVVRRGNLVVEGAGVRERVVRGRERITKWEREVAMRDLEKLGEEGEVVKGLLEELTVDDGGLRELEFGKGEGEHVLKLGL